MDTREQFVSDLLYYTRKGETIWVPLSSLPKEKRLPIPPNLDIFPAYVSFSGENDIFTYCIIETASDKKYYVFITYLKGNVAFILQQSELSNPYTLKALFDAAAKKTTEDMLREMKKSLEQAGYTVTPPLKEDC